MRREDKTIATTKNWNIMKETQTQEERKEEKMIARTMAK